MLEALALDDAFLDEDHRLLRQQARRFVERSITPAVAQWEADGRIPAEAYLELGRAGLLGLSLPVEYGGSGMDTLAAVILSEELTRSGYCGVPGSVVVHTDMSSMHLVRAGTPEQRARFLPDIVAGKRICALGVTEPRGGSDLVRLATNARRDGGDWLLNGHKLYITNAHIADLFFVIARTDPDAKGAKGCTLFLVERGSTGFSNGARTNKVAQHCSDNGELFFNDCRVPAANVIGEVGAGFYTMMAGLEHERIVIAAQASAISEMGLEVTLEWLRSRKAYGGSLWDLQAIRHELAMLTTELAAVQTLLYHAAARASAGGDTKLTSAMLKACLPALTDRIFYKCVQFHGGVGYMADAPIVRMAQEARIFSIGGGATEPMLDEIAKRL